MAIPEVFQTQKKQAQITLLYCGRRQDWWDQTSQQLLGQGLIVSHTQLKQESDAQTIDTLITDWAQATLLILDYDDQLLNRLKDLQETWHGGNYGFLALSDEPPTLSFLHMLDLINHDLLFIGKPEITAEFLEQSLKGGQDAIDLSAPASRRASEWLRDLKHDYFNVVAALGQEIKASGVWDQQYQIQFLQDTLRNLLAYPLKSRRARPLDKAKSGITLDWETSLEGDLSITAELQKTLPEDWEDFVLSEAANASKTIPVIPAHGAPPETSSGERPSTYVYYGDPEPKATWDTWRVELTSGMAGAYGPQHWHCDNYDHPVELKHYYWKTLCLFSLPEVFDRLADAIVTTAEALTDTLTEDEITRFYRIWINLCNAKRLYCAQ